MKRRNKYRKVEELPKGALAVPAYAKSLKVKEPYIYKLWRLHVKEEKQINFEIVLYQGYNFVIPKT
jgi:hypothetical protein